MTLKEILDAVLMETGFGEQPTYAGSTDPDYRQLVALANRSNRVLSRYDWQALRSSVWITIVAGQETYDLPADFRAYIPNTAYKEKSIEYVALPTNNQYWAYLKADNSPSGVVYKARFIGNQLHVHDAGPNGGRMRMDYISDNAVESHEKDPQTMLPVYIPRFVNDQDKWRLDDDLIIMDLVWRWRRKQGIEQWQADRVDFESYLNRTRGDDGGARTLRFSTPLEQVQWPPDSPQTDLWM